MDDNYRVQFPIQIGGRIFGAELLSGEFAPLY